MPITRNTDQKDQNLTEFYLELKNSTNSHYQETGTLMLNWIDRINQEFKETQIWGLTSHDYLILQTVNDYTSPIYVVLIAEMEEYYIEYLMPKEKEPWENAYVKGSTKSLDQAMIMLKKAMLESKGWRKSKELN